MTTQVPNVTFRYSHTIGRRENAGSGFRTPCAMALGEENRVYVINRSSEFRADGLRVTICTVDEEYIGEFAKGGATINYEAASPDAPLVWPSSIALDKEGNVYITDEWLDRVSVFTKDGEPITRWGTSGDGDGDLSGPSGITFDRDDNLYLVDSKNYRVQKFTKDGKFLAKWGRAGDREGEFNLPWGIDVDHHGDVYVADWRNDRIQKFSPDGHFLMKIGTSGTGDGEFNRPSGVAVDKEGIVYVTDWGNDRLQIFYSDGSFATELTGDATLSKWGKEKLDANPDMWLQRTIAHGIDREKRFWGPVSVEVDTQGQIFVVESARFRIQVYRKITPFFLGLYDNARL